MAKLMRLDTYDDAFALASFKEFFLNPPPRQVRIKTDEELREEIRKSIEESHATQTR